MGCVGLHRVPCGINRGIFRHGSALVVLAATAALELTARKLQIGAGRGDNGRRLEDTQAESLPCSMPY